MLHAYWLWRLASVIDFDVFLTRLTLFPLHVRALSSSFCTCACHRPCFFLFTAALFCLYGLRLFACRQVEVASGVFFFLLLVGVGTVVFMVSGDMSFIDAFYLTVVSSSTVGYGEQVQYGRSVRICVSLAQPAYFVFYFYCWLGVCRSLAAVLEERLARFLLLYCCFWGREIAISFCDAWC